MATYNVDLQDDQGNSYRTMANPDSKAEFTEATSRENINSGETHRTIFGKLRKFLSDLGAAAYIAIANNCTTTAAGFALDARQGKVLMDKSNQISSDLESLQTSFQDGCNALVSKCTELGVAPVTNSPDDIADAIQSIYETATALGLKVNSFSIPRTNGSHITLTYNAGHVVKYAGLNGFGTQSAGSATGGGPTCSLSVSWSGTRITVATWGTGGGTEVQGYYFY